jgi:hypothetical protein
MAVSLSGMTLHTNNDADGNWTNTDGPDTYGYLVQGGGSESWQVTKNAVQTATLSLASSLNPTRSLFVFWMSSILASVYTDIQLEMISTAGNSLNYTISTSANPVVSGIFIPLAIDYVNKGIPTGTFAPAGFSSLDIVVDNSTSGNIRGIPNNWIDAMYYGPGHTISGTTVGDLLFSESAGVDELLANKYGILQNFNGIIYSLGDIVLSGTALTSIGETFVFIETPNGYDTYEFDVTGTVVLTNTAIQASGAIDFNFDTSTATAFTMNGGSISGFLSLTTGASQTTNGVVFNSGGTSILSNTPDGSTFNTCGQISFNGAGSLSKCIINKSSATAAILTSSLDLIDACDFVSDGTGHAVELGTIGSTQSMSWNSTTTGYAGSDGASGNEVIAVTIQSPNILTINVSGVTSPTINKTGTGTVSVINAVALTIEGSSGISLLGSEIRIYDYNGTGGSLGDNLQGVESAPGSTYVYSGASSNLIYIQIMKDGYEEFGQSFTMPASPATFTASLKTEENV